MSRHRRLDPNLPPRSIRLQQPAASDPDAAPIARPQAAPPPQHPRRVRARSCATKAYGAALPPRPALRAAPDSSVSECDRRCATRSPRAAPACASRILRAPSRWTSSCRELPEPCAQRLQGAKMVRLDAAFGTAHGACHLGDIHSLKITQQKRLTLPAGQIMQCFFKRCHRFVELKAPWRRDLLARSLRDGIKRVIVFLIAVRGKPRHDA